LWRLGGDAPVALIEERYQRLVDLVLYGDGGRCWIVGPVEDTTHPQELYAFDTDTGEEHLITALHPELGRLPRVPARLVPMKGLKGEDRMAAVWLPAGYEPGRRYPTIIDVYLGSGVGLSSFAPDKLLLAGRGYVVVWPEMPVVPEVEAAEAATCYALTALEAAVAQGYADAERAVVMGHSTDGYNVCCIVTRTDRLRAAIASAPFTDLVSFALSIRGNRLTATGNVEGGFIRMGGTIWEQTQHYLANSPVVQAHRVTTPLLLLCGTADSLIAQADEMYAPLLRLGKVATLVRYHGEGHVPYREWSDENYDDYWARILEWLGRWLGGPQVQRP
jgi:dipeptidyl aminopeptidase/acylaminoacyl peptidase